MRKSNIPPRTMRDLARERNSGSGAAAPPSPATAASVRRTAAQPASDGHATGLFRRPRNWRFQTKPLFKKLHGPLVDVFEEADEVLIVIDLSGFQPGEVSLRLTPEKYVIHARRGRETFHEEIVLPPEVDLARCAEQFRNGILEITLPHRAGPKRPRENHERHV